MVPTPTEPVQQLFRPFYRLHDRVWRWQVPLNSYRLFTISGKRHNYPAMSPTLRCLERLPFSISPRTANLSQPLNTRQGVRRCIPSSCLSLVAVLGLLVLPGVSIFFSTRLGISPQKCASPRQRSLRGSIGPLRTRTTSAPVSPCIPPVSWSPISLKARHFDIRNFTNLLIVLKSACLAGFNT